MISERAKGKLAKQAWATWIRPLSPISLDIDRGLLTVGVPNRDFLAWLNSNYAEPLAAARDLAGLTCKIQFAVVAS